MQEEWTWNRRCVAALAVAACLLFAPSDARAQQASLQDLAKAAVSLPELVIYTAREIVTLDPAKPTAQAVAVVGDRILAVGSLDELKKAAGDQPYSVNTVFATTARMASTPSAPTRWSEWATSRGPGSPTRSTPTCRWPPASRCSSCGPA